MPVLTRRAALVTVALASAGAGAGVSAIASAGAATPKTTSAKAPSARGSTWMRLSRRAVHGDAVVATKTGFATYHFDRGYVVSVHGDSLTLREATAKATYDTVSVTVPATARIRNDRHKTTLGQLRAGEHVLVLQGPKRTVVTARSA